MKHRATMPNAYAHDEFLGMKYYLPRFISLVAAGDPTSC